MSQRPRRVKLLLLGTGIPVVAVLVSAWVLSGHRVPAVFRKLSDADQDRVPPLADKPWGDERVDKIEALHGRTQEEVAADLSEPNQTYEFSVEEVRDEFRIELLNTYPPGHPRSRGVRIREWQWKHREFSLAVWFHMVEGRWVVLDTCRWKKGIAF
jgi:hypothetical protein